MERGCVAPSTSTRTRPRRRWLGTLHPSATPCEPRGCGGPVEGDAVQLQRLVRNLLDNAARHATSVVTVTLGEVAGDAVLRVDDDGPGHPCRGS